MASNNALSYMRRKTWRYVRNVGKSVGYVAVEELKPHSSAITQLYKDARELSSNVRASAKANKAARIRNQTKTTTLSGSANVQKRQGSAFTKNLLSDLKSGKWYNQERMDKASMDMFEMGADADNYTGVSFDFGDDDFGDALFNDGQGQNAATLSGGGRRGSTVSKAFNQVGMASSAVAAEASIRSAEFIANSNNMAAKAIYDSMNYNFGQVMLGLSSIDANIQVVQATVNDTLNTHALNSAKFYIDSSKYQQESLELLKKISTAVENINTNTSPAPHGSNRRGGKDYTLSNLLSGGRGGLLDFKSLKSNIKSGIKDEFMPNLLLMLGLGGDLGGTGAGLASNPIGLITMELMRRMGADLIPRRLKGGVGNVNNVIKNFFGKTITRVRGTDFKKIFNQNNPLLAFLTPFFNEFKDAVLPKSNYTKIDTGRYNKGRVDWDGIARKSLVEVIPTQLGKILSALTGENEMRYDFEHGRWVDTHKHLEDFNKNRRREKSLMGGDFMGYSSSLISNSNMSDKDKARMNQMMESFNQGVYKSAGTSAEMEYLMLISPTRRIDANLLKIAKDKYGIRSQKELENLRSLAAAMRSTHIGRNALNSYGQNMAIGKDMMGSTNRYNESLNNSMINMMVDGSYGFGNAAVAKTKASAVGSNANWKKNKQNPLQSIMYATDDYNHDIFFYLQGIFQYTKHVSDNLPLLITGVGKGKKGKMSGVKISASMKSVEPISTETIEGPEEDTDEMGSNFNVNDAGIKATNAEFDGTMSDNLRQHARTRQWAMNNGMHEYMLQNNEDYAKSEEEFQKYTSKFGGGNSGRLRSLANKTRIGRKITGGYDKFVNILEAIGGSRQDLESAIGFALPFTNQIKNARQRAVNNRVAQGIFSPEALAVMGGYNNGQAARGRKVTKTGIVAVSEGELIIPSELNPFYHGITNKAQQMRNEQRAVKQYFGNYAKGGNVVARPETLSLQNLMNYYMYNLGMSAKDTYKEAKKRIGSFENEFNSGKRGPQIQGRGNTTGFNLGNITGMAGKAKGAIMGGFNNIGDDLVNIFGPRDAKAAEGEKKKIAELIKGAFDDAGMTKSSMITGAVLGGGVSLLTGAIVGPLAGAAIGAATGLVVKSKKVQEALFGKDVEETDEKGNKVSKHKNGLLPKKIADFMQKQLPSLAQGTATGAAAGAVFGSPIIGAIVGSSIGFIKSSDKAKDALFGKVDEQTKERTGGIIPKPIQDMVKKAVPNMAAGAALGLLAGPFGLAGNVIMGSALGFATSTNKFQDWLYGKEDPKTGKREGGFADKVKKELFDPISTGFKNLTSIASQQFVNLSKSLAKSAREFMFNHVGKLLLKTTIGRKVANVTKGIGRKVWGAITAPGKALERRTRKTALNKGYTIENMTSKERLQLRESGDVGDYYNMVETDKGYGMDLLLGSYNDNDKRQELLTAIGRMENAGRNSEDAIMDERRRVKKEIEGILGGRALKRKDRRELQDIYQAIGRQEINPNDQKTMARIQELTGASPDEMEKIAKSLRSIKMDDTIRTDQKKLAESRISTLIDENDKISDVQKEKIKKSLLSGNTKDIEFIKNQLGIDMKNPEGDQKAVDDAIKNQIPNKISKVGQDIVHAIHELKAHFTGEDVGKLDYRAGLKTKDANVFEEQYRQSQTTEGRFSRFKELQNQGVSAVDALKTIKGEETAQLLYRGGFARRGLAAVSKGELILPRSFWGSFADGTPSVDNPDVDSLGEDNVVRGQHGNIEENKGSKAVYESNKRKNSFFGAIGSIPIGFAAMNKTLQEIKGALTTGYKDGNEKKPGLFDMLKNSLFGGAIDKIKGVIATGIQYAAPVLAGALAGKLALSIAKGKLDKFGEKIGFGQASHYGNTYVDADGDQVTRDENGQYVKEDGTPATGTIKAVNSSTNASMGDRFKANFIRGTITGTGSVAGAMIKGAVKSTRMGRKMIDSTGKLVSIAKNSKFVQNIAGKAAPKFLENVNKSGILTKLSDTLMNLASKLRKVPFLAKFSDYIDDISLDLMEFLEKKTLGTTAKAAGAILKSAAIAVQWALVIADCVTGWQDAPKILGIKKATAMQKFGCALCRALLRAIPIIGSFLPEKKLIQFIFKHLPGGEKLMQAQSALQDEVDQYNEENGTNLSVDEYQTQVLGQSNIFDKAGNAIKSGFANAKNFFGKNKAAGATADVSNTETAYAGSYANGGVVSFGSGATSGISNIGESALAGIGSKVANITTKIKEDVDKGDVKAIIKDAGKVGLGVAAGSMLPALIGPAMVNALINKVTGTTNVEKSGSGSSKLSKAFNMVEKLFNYAKDGDTKGIDSLKIDTNSGMLTGIFNIVKAVTKIAAIVTNPLKWLGNTLLGAVTGNKESEDTGKQSLLQRLGSALGIGTSSASGSGFVSQFDPRYRNKRLGGRSIADNGCGPASAVMAINQLNAMSGRGTSMNSAIQHASRYQTNGGTDAAYFADEFARNGYRAQYSTNKANILRNIASGRPTILMGRAGGSSKAFTPFGPNNHYVVANGIDSRGNIIISDPEQGGRSVYNPAILGQVRLGVSGGATTYNQMVDQKKQKEANALATYNGNFINNKFKNRAKTQKEKEALQREIEFYQSLGDDSAEYILNQQILAQEANDYYNKQDKNKIRKNILDIDRRSMGKYAKRPTAYGQTSAGLKNYNGYEFYSRYGAGPSQRDIYNMKLLAMDSGVESDIGSQVISNELVAERNKESAAKAKAREQLLRYNNKEMLRNIYGTSTGTNVKTGRFSDLEINGYIMSKGANSGYNNGAPDANKIYEWAQDKKKKEEAYNASYSDEVRAAKTNKLYNTSVPTSALLAMNKANDAATLNNNGTGPSMYQIGLMKDKALSANSFLANNSKYGNTSIPTSAISAMSNGGYDPTANLKYTTLPGSKNDSSTDSGAVGGAAAAAIAGAYASSNLMGTENSTGTSGTSSSSAESSEETNKYKGMGILEAIGSIFGDALGKIFGKALTGSATSGKNKMSTAATMASFTGKDPVDYMLSKLNQISYSYGACNVEGGSSDCSGMVQWAVQQAVGINIGRSSREQANCSKYLDTVADAGGRHKYFDAQNMPQDLQRNDLLFFIRYNDHCDGDIGHVGIYIGDGQFIDHGSGMGPKIKKLNGSREQGLTKVCRLKEEILQKLAAQSDNGYNAAAPRVYGKVGGSYPDTDVTRTIYRYFTNNGYTPAATAGIMGNMYRESRFDPAAIQKGSGHAAGLVQWESYKNKSNRWKSLDDYANSIGKPWQDLNTQLNFINQEMHGNQYTGTNASVYRNASEYFNAMDPAQAAYDFEKAYERGSVEAMDERMGAAQAYYDAYGGANMNMSDSDMYNTSVPTSVQQQIMNNEISASGSGIYNTMGRYIARRKRPAPQNVKFVGSGSAPIIHKAHAHNFNSSGKSVATSPVVYAAGRSNAMLSDGGRNTKDPLVTIVDKLCDIIGNLSDMHDDVSGIHNIMKDEHDVVDNLEASGSGKKKPLKNSSLPKRTMSNEQIAASLSELKAQVRQIVV